MYYLVSYTLYYTIMYYPVSYILYYTIMYYPVSYILYYTIMYYPVSYILSLRTCIAYQDGNKHEYESVFDTFCANIVYYILLQCGRSITMHTERIS